MSNDPPTPTAPKSPAFSIKNVLVLALIPVALVLAWVGYEYMQAQPENTGSLDDLIGQTDRLKGDLSKMADGFVDADGDLIADAPAQTIDPEVLIFAGIASPESPEQQARLQPLMDHLAKATGKKIEFRPVPDAGQQVEFLRDGKLHVTVVNTGLVQAAVNRGGFVPYCAPATEEGNYRYEMLLITPAGGEVAAPEQVKGKVMAVVATTSHSGYKMPIVYLRDEKNLVVGRDYDIVLTGGHFQTIEAIAKKAYPVGAVASELFDRATAEGGKVKASDIRVIHRSGPTNPAAPWGYSHTLDPKLVAKLRKGFDDFRWAGTPFEENYKGTQFVKFAKVDYAKDWEPIRKVDAAIANWNRK